MPHAQLDADVGVVRLQTVWNDKELVRAIPGARWDAQRKNWTLPLSWASLVVARGVFRDRLTVDQPLANWSWREHRERVEPALELRQALEPVDDGSPEYRVVRSWSGGDAQPSLFHFQEAGVQFMLRAGSGLLGDEMGSGDPQDAADPLADPRARRARRYRATGARRLSQLGKAPLGG
jgi:hypothetical protein